MTAHYEVQIVNPATGRPKAWKTYAVRELAEVEAAKLRVHKFFVQIRCIDDQVEAPEHRGDRRRFLCWALMIGATSPQVVADRIVDEIEREAQQT